MVLLLQKGEHSMLFRLRREVLSVEIINKEILN